MNSEVKNYIISIFEDYKNGELELILIELKSGAKLVAFVNPSYFEPSGYCILKLPIHLSERYQTEVDGINEKVYYSLSSYESITNPLADIYISEFSLISTPSDKLITNFHAYWNDILSEEDKENDSILDNTYSIISTLKS